MKKLTLIHEIDINGNVWYWVELNGDKISTFFNANQREDAELFFKTFKPSEPSKTVIAEKEV